MSAPHCPILGFQHVHWEALIGSVSSAVRGRATREEVEDAVSVALLRACERAPAHRNLMGWLHQTATNALRDVLKSRRVRGRVALSEADHVIESTPESLLLANEFDVQREALVRRVHALLPALPRHERDALRLSLAGESGDSISRQLGCSTGAVRTRVHRGRRRLRSLLTQEGLSHGAAA